MMSLVLLLAAIAGFYFGGFYWGMAGLFVFTVFNPMRQPDPKGSDQYQQNIYRENEDNRMMALGILVVILIGYSLWNM